MNCVQHNETGFGVSLNCLQVKVQIVLYKYQNSLTIASSMGEEQITSPLAPLVLPNTFYVASTINFQQKNKCQRQMNMAFRFSKVRIPRTFKDNSLKLTSLGPIMPYYQEKGTIVHWKRFKHKNAVIAS